MTKKIAERGKHITKDGVCEGEKEKKKSFAYKQKPNCPWQTQNLNDFQKWSSCTLKQKHQQSNVTDQKSDAKTATRFQVTLLFPCR